MHAATHLIIDVLKIRLKSVVKTQWAMFTLIIFCSKVSRHTLSPNISEHVHMGVCLHKEIRLCRIFRKCLGIFLQVDPLLTCKLLTLSS